MQVLLRLYAYDTRYCACEEKELWIRFDPERRVPLDESFIGQVKTAWKVWRER